MDVVCRSSWAVVPAGYVLCLRGIMCPLCLLPEDCVPAGRLDLPPFAPTRPCRLPVTFEIATVSPICFLLDHAGSLIVELQIERGNTIGWWNVR